MLLMSWSSGKDSAMALKRLLDDSHSVQGLFTTVSQEYERIGLHGVRKLLLEQQAESLGLPLHIASLSASFSMEEYANKLIDSLKQLKKKGFNRIGYGDIFLEDLKDYRLQYLKAVDMEPIFPIWREPTRTLMTDFLCAGFQAITTAVNAEILDSTFVGRVIDSEFLAQLPENIDPCGENGEFHTFAFDGPIFKEPISFTKGDVVLKDGYLYCDLIPKEG